MLLSIQHIFPTNDKTKYRETLRMQCLLVDDNFFSDLINNQKNN